MRVDEFLEWLKRRLEVYKDVPVTLDGALLCESILRAAQQLQAEEGAEWITIPAAASDCGYSPQHIRRLANSGRLPSKGKGKSRTVLRQALPKKVPKVAARDENLHLFLSAEQAVRESVGNS